MVRESAVIDATEAGGALGISRKTVAESGRERDTAIRAPPAEIFTTEANSRVCLPPPFVLPTKTGIASGRRVHLRRSVSGLLRFKQGPRGLGLHHSIALGGPNSVIGTQFQERNQYGKRFHPGRRLSSGEVLAFLGNLWAKPAFSAKGQ